MHDLSTETLLSRYSLRGVLSEPITAGAAALTLAGSAISAMGTISSGNASNAAGQASKNSYYYKAAQEEAAATEARATAQRSSFEKRKAGTLALSTLQARAASSGGGAEDETVIGLAGDIAGDSEYNALYEMYKGENKARGYEDAAVGSRLTGDAAAAEGSAKQTASYYSAAGTIIGGAGSAIKAKYG